MKRFKQIMTFVIIGVLFIILTEYLIRVGLRNSYKTISGEIKSVSPQITVTEAKATDVNGYIEGRIKNASEDDIAALDEFTRPAAKKVYEYFHPAEKSGSET